MTPQEFKAILDRGTPGPWYPLGDDWVTLAVSVGNLPTHAAVLGDTFNALDNGRLAALSVNLAPLLVELWEAVEPLAEELNLRWSRDHPHLPLLVDVLAALAALASFKGES